MEVFSRYHGNEMTFPTAHPARVVCELSQHRDRRGDATVVYKVLRPGKARFFSSFTHPTNAADPAMRGQIVVTH